MNRSHIYSIFDKKGKVLCVIQYKFNVLVNSPLASININYTLLAVAFSTNITLTFGTTDTNMKDAMAADATSGKKKVIQKLSIQWIYIYMCILIYWKMERNVKKYSSHILTHLNIY